MTDIQAERDAAMRHMAARAIADEGIGSTAPLDRIDVTALDEGTARQWRSDWLLDAIQHPPAKVKPKREPKPPPARAACAFCGHRFNVRGSGSAAATFCPHHRTLAGRAWSTLLAQERQGGVWRITNLGEIALLETDEYDRELDLVLDALYDYAVDSEEHWMRLDPGSTSFRVGEGRVVDVP